MRYCPACDLMFGEKVERCPTCHGPLDERESTDPFPWPRPADVVAIYEPPDQLVAGALLEILRQRGFKAAAVGHYNPYLGDNLLARSSIAVAHGLYGGAWGRIFVFRRDEAAARAIIEEWLRGTPQWPEDVTPETEDNSPDRE